MDAVKPKSSLAIIPARGGSKGVPRKNIREVAGKPLIAWTIQEALKADSLQRILVSTDDFEIAEVARQWGAEVPFMRPAELAGDDTTDFPVYQHALQWLLENEGARPEVVVWLRPTTPLRRSDDIDGAVARLLSTGADWVRSVCLVEHHPYWMYRTEGDRLLPFLPEIDIRQYIRRQLLPPVYRLNGVVDVCWWQTIMEKELLYSGDIGAYVVPAERSIDIDTEMDLKLAAFLLSAGQEEAG